MPVSFRSAYLWHLGKGKFKNAMEKYEVVGSFRKAFDRHIRKRGSAMRRMAFKNKKVL